ncbi:MAG: deoxyguanosinetriphosphate triphosphohydrolase [Firmicutes bacterium HGW-Firmicutes-16]|nr:MAG: deoxyguanosinetriphosphate triphosphohydrolase [Firmicutes bacterium HGW-Firmicutes-16]
MISDIGVLAENSKGRAFPEAPDEVRTCFQRDIDRITYSKSFRRLKHKTQVFLQPEGDHYRTRLTHTLEVTRIARTISRALMLNEDLTEAIGLGHDLGHTPFGHAGERALCEIYTCGFRHYEQSLRVVDRLEKSGKGLNLCFETRMGILNHTKGAPDDSAEAIAVRLADRIAYINHDVDDAIRAGILTAADIPKEVRARIGERHSTRIDAIIRDVIEASREGEVRMSDDMAQAVELFHDFLFEKVYRNPTAKGEEAKVSKILGAIWDYYLKNPDKLPPDYRSIADTEGVPRAVCDYVSGMSDDYAVYTFSNIYIPAAWQVK